MLTTKKNHSILKTAISLTAAVRLGRQKQLFRKYMLRIHFVRGPSYGFADLNTIKSTTDHSQRVCLLLTI